MKSTLLLLILISVQTFAAAPYPKIIDQAALKESVDPCDDFYQFSCGTWIDQTTIPADEEDVYRQSTPMMDSVDVRLNQILQSYAKGDFKIPATYAVKLADYYKSCMAAESNTSEAMQLLKADLAKIANMKSADDLARVAASLQMVGAGLFNLNSMQDYNDSSVILADLSQGGMVLGNPSYYLDQDAKAVEIRAHYKDYIAKMFVAMGTDKIHARGKAERILRLETKLAKYSFSVTDQSDPNKVNHVMNLESVKKLAPDFNWNLYFQTLGLSTDKFNVDEPQFFENLNTLLKQLPENEKVEYFSWLLMDKASDKVGGKLAEYNFAFWSTYLSGTQQRSPRWKDCTEAVESKLGYALAEAYVKTFDGAAIKVKTNSMIDSIKAMFVSDLHALSEGPTAWIDQDTAAEGIVKAQIIDRKVGAPEKFRNYDALVLNSNYLANSFAVSKFESRRDLNKVGKPVDKSEWGMMPWEVNAYYDRSNNEFVFPFGILQPPSLDLQASDGANYGAFGGGTIGHELTHGFDSAGSKYDSHGNLKNWWSAETQELFNQKTKCYVNQASQYRIKDVGLNVDGNQTLEENLADQGGVKLGYMVLNQILASRAPAAPWLGKYTERQQYWIAYAQSWCMKTTPEALRSQMTNDVHPPAEFRVNAVVMNRPEFAGDFKCAAGRAMAPVNRCELW